LRIVGNDWKDLRTRKAHKSKVLLKESELF
jgi:hypothetical protein